MSKIFYLEIICLTVFTFSVLLSNLKLRKHFFLSLYSIFYTLCYTYILIYLSAAFITIQITKLITSLVIKLNKLIDAWCFHSFVIGLTSILIYDSVS